MTRTVVVLTGRVQGVGFRDAVLRTARRYAVAGSVRNLRDRSRLEIDAEGDQSEIDAFIADVLANPPSSAYVDQVEQRAAEPSARRGFTVLS